MIRIRRVEQFALQILLLLFLINLPALGNRITVEASGRDLNRTLARYRQGDTLILESGTYRGKFFIPPGCVLISEELHGAIIDGSGHNRAIIMQNSSTLYGLSVTGARVGVYSEGIDNEIIGCRIYNNHHSGIIVVANALLIKDNFIYRNLGSGITLWDVKSDTATIAHNTIVYNGNHGVAIGGVSELEISDNIIAFNHKLKIQINEDSRLVQRYNNYYFNVEINELLPQGNYSFDPRFENPLRNDFQLSDSSRCINSGSNGSDLGSEIFSNYNY